MSTKSGKERGGGEKTNEIPPKNTVPEVVKVPDSAYDVTITVGGQKFQCLKEELSNHSIYFRKVFDSSFEEKHKKEVELGGMVESESFDLFLKMIRGESIMNDVTVENLLKLAKHLESTTLEENCLHHLANDTAFSLSKQFEMAEKYHFEKLMIQVCASFKNADHLDRVVPADVTSLCNSTKNAILQRTFELLGVRNAPSPQFPDKS